MPTPRFYSNVNRFSEPPAGRVPELGDTYTEETVEGHHPGGLLQIRGLATPTRNGLQARLGDRVTVLWRRGLPFMVVDARTRKGPGDDPPRPGGPVVEELFVAARPADSVVDVWFRNFDQCAPLLLDAHGVADPAYVRWGPSNSHFLVRDAAATKIWVFKFNRRDATAFKAGAAAPQKVQLVRAYDLAATTAPTVATVNPANMPGGAISLTPANTSETHTGGGASVTAELAQTDVSLDLDGDLVVSYAVTVGGSGRTVSGGTAQPCGSPSPIDIVQIVSFSLSYPVVVNLRTGAVLLDTYTAGVVDEFAPAPGSAFAFNSLDLLALPGTWTLLAEHTNDDPLSPCFGLVDAQVYYFRYSAALTSHFLAPILSQPAQADPPLAARVNGYLGFLRRTGSIPPEARLKVGVGTDPGTPLPANTDGMRAAIARPPDGGGAAVSLFQVGSGVDQGVAVTATYDRAVWSPLPNTSVFRLHDLRGLSQGNDGFVTHFLTGATAQLTTNLQAAVGNRGVVVAPTDFAYQLDNPADGQPVPAKNRYFVKLWPFLAASPLANVDAGQYPEDAKLRRVAALKAVPAGTAQPTASELFSLQVVNSKLSLPGRYQRTPVVSG